MSARVLFIHRLVKAAGRSGEGREQRSTPGSRWNPTGGTGPRSDSYYQHSSSVSSVKCSRKVASFTLARALRRISLLILWPSTLLHVRQRQIESTIKARLNSSFISLVGQPGLTPDLHPLWVALSTQSLQLGSS